MKIIVNNLESKIETDNVTLLKALISKYSFTVPGAFYTKAYKNKKWNGKKQFISDGGKFKTGLLSRVLQDLKLVEITPEIENVSKLNETEVTLDLNLKNFSLRDYQKSIVINALNSKRALIKSPTGSGKTALLACLLNSYKNKSCLVLFHRKQLLIQTYEFLKKHTNLDVGVVFGEGNDLKPITLATYQSLGRIIGTPLEKPDVLIVDEVHEFAKGKLTTKLINTFPTALARFGFTATIPTEKIALYTLEGAFGSVIEEVETQDLIASGFLAKPNIQIIPITCSSTEESYLNYYDDLIVFNTKRNKIIKLICDSIKHPNPKILILVQRLDHAKILNKLLENSIKLEGKDSISSRKNSISDFIQNKQILIGSNILQTGVDIKEITHLINARGLKSDIATLQALGRALRLDKDSEVFVYDFQDNGHPILLKHSKARIKAYKREGHNVTFLPELL